MKDLRHFLRDLRDRGISQPLAFLTAVRNRTEPTAEIKAAVDEVYNEQDNHTDL